MMKALKLKPREVVELTWCKLREGKQVRADDVHGLS
jgi:hypothetical protein